MIEDQVGAKGPLSMGKSIFTSAKFAGSPIVTEPSGWGVGGVGCAGSSGKT